MAKFELRSVTVQDEPDDLCAFGMVELDSRSSNIAVMVPIISIPEKKIIMGTEYDVFGTPLRILTGEYEFLKLYGILTPCIYHELGHVVNDDHNFFFGSKRRFYTPEHNADVFASKHCGLENVLRLLRVLSLIYPNSSGEYQELLFRAADLGDPNAIKAIQIHGIERKEWI